MPQSYKTEVRVSGEWCADSLRYAAEAAAAGIKLRSRWMQPTDNHTGETYARWQSILSAPL